MGVGEFRINIGRIGVKIEGLVIGGREGGWRPLIAMAARKEELAGGEFYIATTDEI